MDTINAARGYKFSEVQYVVVAGKYESDGERNYKFISEPFASFDEAQSVARMYETFPFCEVQLSAIVEVK